MKKKTIPIIIILVLAVCVAAGVYYFTQRDGSVGINENITNEDNKTASMDMDGKKVLVVYFSETGNTQKLAKIISDQVGGDFRRIEPVNPYPEGEELFDYTREERD